ncbi:MAG: PAS domain S-box protein [Chloroflexi bacterium]|nr:PAS domain S-box protein [Chloroflexota bacterium]
MKRRTGLVIAQYGVAVLLVAIALVITNATALRVASPLLLFIVAATVVAWFGGLGPGILATILAFAALAFFVFPPEFSFAIQDPLDLQQLTLFAVLALALSALIEIRLRRERVANERARLQTALAEIGQSALTTQDLAAFLYETTTHVCQALDLEYCALGEFAPELDALLFQAGAGWSQDWQGRAISNPGPESFADVMLTATEPIVIKNLRVEKRFSIPAFFSEHAVASGIAVQLSNDGQPFGALGAFSSRRRNYSTHAIAFLQATATLLATTIERDRVERVVHDHRDLLLTTLLGIHDAVIATDARGDVTFMNPAAETLTGWTLGETLGNPLVVNISDAETFQPIENPVTRVLRERRAHNSDAPSVFIPKSGRALPVDYACTPIRDQDDQVSGAVLILRDATERLRNEQSIFRLAAIVNASEDAVFSQTLDGIVQTWNPGAERLLGYAASEMIGKSISLTFPSERLDEFPALIHRLRQGEPIEQQDTVRVRKDGEPIHVSLSVSHIKDAAGRIIGVSTIARDITERQRAEQVQRFLAEASELLVSSLDPHLTLARVAQLAAPSIADWCAIHLVTGDGALDLAACSHGDPTKLDKVRDLLRRYPPKPEAHSGVPNVIRTGKPEFLYQVNNDQLASLVQNIEHLKLLVEVGMGAYIIVPLLARERAIGTLSLCNAARRYVPSDLAVAEDLARRIALAVENARLYHAAQELSQDLEQRVVARTIELQNTNVQLANEVAERQRVNEELRRLSAHLQSAREEERIRIAREIHDQVGQVLTAVKMDLALLDRKLKNTKTVPVADVKADVNRTIQLVDATIKTMREIIRELRPEILDHLGLSAAIEWQLQEFQTRTGIACHFDTTLDEVNLDLDRSTAVFRIFQETLTNVARHANATRVEANLKQEDGTIVLQVRDNGKGLASSDLSDKKTFGVLGMRERAHVFGGEVTLAGAPGEGTTVTVRIPV